MPRTEVLIHTHPKGYKPEACIWINNITNIRGIYLTYFMILFLIDLDQVENLSLF